MLATAALYTDVKPLPYPTTQAVEHNQPSLQSSLRDHTNCTRLHRNRHRARTRLPCTV